MLVSEVIYLMERSNFRVERSNFRVERSNFWLEQIVRLPIMISSEYILGRTG